MVSRKKGWACVILRVCHGQTCFIIEGLDRILYKHAYYESEAFGLLKSG